MRACVHPQQSGRLAALRSLQILDTPREKEFDDVVALVAALCDAPVAVVNLIDSDRQWFKAEVGLGVRSSPLETSLCSHVILENAFVEIPDTLADPRMADNPLCLADGGFRFYAGALLRTKQGFPIGTLCVLDTRPRALTAVQRDVIEVLAKRVMREIEYREAIRQQTLLRREIDHRVKNSLGMIGAILHLQSARATGPEVREALSAVRARLVALEAFHEELHQDNEGETVRLDSVVRRTADKLVPLLPASFQFEIDLPRIDLSSDYANALSLIVNEFATNSAKHGMSGGDAKVTILGTASDDRLQLSMRDHGPATEETLKRLIDATGLGLKVIDKLARSIGSKARWSLDSPGLRLDLDLSVATPDR